MMSSLQFLQRLVAHAHARQRPAVKLQITTSTVAASRMHRRKSLGVLDVQRQAQLVVIRAN
jgi:DNA-binding CsgD family transcriptional regulator